MARADIRKKLYEESDLCRKCGRKTYLPNKQYHKNGEHKPNTATLQHNLFRFEEGYETDLTLFCYQCNDEDNWEKLSSYNFKYNRLFHPDLPHDTLDILARGLISKPKSHKNPLHTTMSGTIFYKDKVLKFHNGIILSSTDFYINKFNLLREYIHIKIDGKIIITFEEFYEKKIKKVFLA